MEPRVRVSALLRWQDRMLLCRQEKPGKEYWLLPGGGVDGGETLIEALRRSSARSSASGTSFHFEGPIAVAESIAPDWTPGDKHVVHIVFGADLSHRSLEDVESHDAAVRGARLFSLDELEGDRRPPADQAVPRALAAGRPGRVPRRALGPIDGRLPRAAILRSGRRAPGPARPRPRAPVARAVRKRFELDRLAGAVGERIREQPVGEPRVPRQQRAVEIGAVDAAARQPS